MKVKFLNETQVLAVESRLQSRALAVTCIFLWSVASVSNAQVATTGGAAQAAASTAATTGAAVPANASFGSAMTEKCKNNAVACMMAAQAVMQVASLLLTSSGASDASDALSAGTTASGTSLSYGTTASDGSTTTAATDSTATPSTLASGTNLNSSDGAATLASMQAALAATGTTISADGSTVTTPDGRTVATSTGSSAADLSAAGFTRSEITAGLAAAQIAAAKADKIQAMKVAGGGEGGGGAVAAPGDPSGSQDMAKFLKKLSKANKGPAKTAKVDGLSKTFGADRIGVAGDNIFDMVSRRYADQDKQNKFIK